MVTEHGRPLVAGLDSADVAAEIQASCLREIEVQEAAAILNRRRREEWIAGRIAAKYAFLFGDRFPESAASGTLYFRMLDRVDLALFSSEAYRSVSVFRDKAPGGGPARVGWSRGSDSVQVAISHSAGISCASIGATGVCSLDLETPAPRVPEFYLHTFTKREREWVGASATNYGLHPEWLYTLLWSARECLLKTPGFKSLSLWNMPALEINISDGVERLVKAHNSKQLSGSFEYLEASTFCGPFRLAVAGAPNRILTAITGLAPTPAMSTVIPTRIGYLTDNIRDSVKLRKIHDVLGGSYKLLDKRHTPRQNRPTQHRKNSSFPPHRTHTPFLLVSP